VENLSPSECENYFGMKQDNITSRIKKKISRIGLGIHVTDKMAVFCIEILKIIPRRFRFWNFLERILEMLCKGATIKKENVLYKLLDLQSFNIVCDEDFEPFMVKWLKPRKNETFVDVGAHIGKYTLQIAKIVGETGRVVAVEPHPTTFQILRRNIELNSLKNVFAVNVACYRKECNIIPQEVTSRR